MASVTRTHPLRPYACFDKKTGAGLDLHDILEEVRADAELCATEATKHITHKNLELVSQYDGKFTCDVWKALGIELYPKRIATGRYSFKKMVQDYAVTQLRNWRFRVDAHTGKRPFRDSVRKNLSPNRPQNLKPILPLYATNSNYRSIRINGATAELSMVVAERWVTFKFKAPEKFLEPGVRVIAPKIHIDNRDRVMFDWYVELPVERAEFSTKYVVGVDVGIANLATVVVRDITTGEVVETSFMNRRIRSLENKIQRTKNQLAALHRTGRGNEAEPHRKALSNRRKEVAILIGQEVADLSWRYGNALVAVEDLSHIINNMKYGRWVRGMIVARITEMVESNGGRVMTVPAAYTSRKCHWCGHNLDLTNYRTPVCLSCQVAWDRDENAAANIAGKLKEKSRHKKAYQTRKRSASKNRLRRSKDTTRPLKHPFRKTGPTPKAPQNQPKNRGNSHRVHHKHTVIKKRGGGVFPVLCAADQPLRDSNVTISAVAPSHGCSDKKPHDYSMMIAPEYLEL